MSKYTPLITALESPAEIDSFNAVAKRLGFNPAAAYVSIQRVRPDLLGPRSARLGFSQVNKTDVSDNVRAEALARVLAGESVKDVAQATGVPAPTLYQMVRKAREKEAAKAADNVTLAAGGSDAINPQNNAIFDVLLASIRAASAQLGTQPEHLCDLLKSQLKH